MAGTALTIVGGVIGFAIGGPLGAQIGMTLGGMVGATLFGPTIKGPRLNDLKVTSSTYGETIPLVFGSARLGTNLIWSSGIKETENTSRAGKGGPKQTTYTYSATFAVGVCEGPITDVIRVWADGKVIWDVTQGRGSVKLDNIGSVFYLAGQILAGKKKKGVRLRVYKGTETQLPDSLIEAEEGVGNVSAMRGLCYIVFEDMQLADYGNRIPQITVEVSKKLAGDFPSLQGMEGAQVFKKASEYIPDFVNNRMLSNTTGNTGSRWNIGTMTVLANHTPVWSSLGSSTLLDDASRCVAMLQEEGLLIVEDAFTGNCRRLMLVDPSTNMVASYIGENAGTVQPIYFRTSIEKAREGHLRLGAYGELAVCYAGGIRYYVKTTWTNHLVVLKDNDKVPVYIADCLWEGYRAITGMVNAGEVFHWRAANNQLELMRTLVASGAEGEEVWNPSTNDFRWKNKDVSVSYIYLKPYAGEAYVPKTVLFDPSDNTIFSMGTTNGVPCAFKYSAITGQFIWQQKYSGNVRVTESEHRFSRIQGGMFGWTGKVAAADRYFNAINLSNGDILFSEKITNNGIFGDLIYMDGTKSNWDDASSSIIIEAQAGTFRVGFGTSVGDITPAGIVSELCLRTRILTQADFSVSGLTGGKLTGYVLDRETSARDAFKQLGTAFLFDGYESDYQLKFRSRGGASQMTIPQDWIGRNSDGIVIQRTNTNEVELPAKVIVNHYDVTRDYQKGTQQAKRLAGPIPTMLSPAPETIELPICWHPDQAKQTAEKLLFMIWANRVNYQKELPSKYLALDPTDVVTAILDDGTTYIMRLGEVTIGADFTIQSNGVSEKASAYSSSAVGTRGKYTPPSIPLAYPATPVILNTPLLRDLDYDATGNATIYYTAKSAGTTFHGAYMFEQDVGGEFTSIGKVEGEALIGAVSGTLPTTKSYEATDTTTELVVTFPRQATLSSVSQDALLAGANAALVGEEVIQFRDATQVDAYTWKLTNLLRARRGTDYAVNAHVVGESFILLDTASIYSKKRAPADYNAQETYRAVPPGGLLTEATGVTVNLTPRDLMPYAPAAVKFSDDGTTATLSAYRRSRVTAPLLDGFGAIPYKEGEKSSARMVYKIWFGKTLADTATGDTPNIEGEARLFNDAGDDTPMAVAIPYANLGGATQLLVKVYEKGFVDGIPRWVSFTRQEQGPWDAVELY